MGTIIATTILKMLIPGISFLLSAVYEFLTNVSGFGIARQSCAAVKASSFVKVPEDKKQASLY